MKVLLQRKKCLTRQFLLFASVHPTVIINHRHSMHKRVWTQALRPWQVTAVSVASVTPNT